MWLFSYSPILSFLSHYLFFLLHCTSLRLFIPFLASVLLRALHSSFSRLSFLISPCFSLILSFRFSNPSPSPPFPHTLHVSDKKKTLPAGIFNSLPLLYVLQLWPNKKNAHLKLKNNPVCFPGRYMLPLNSVFLGACPFLQVVHCVLICKYCMFFPPLFS